MKAKAIKVMYGPKDMEITLTVDRDEAIIQSLLDLKREVEEKEGMLDVQIKKYREKRSLDANSYCWIIADKIAKVIQNTKEFVYKETIKQVGTFEILPIQEEALEKWIERWEAKGIGWQSIALRDSKIKGYINTINYYGSSVYDSKEMSILLEELVNQAEELGIETITPEEKERLVNSWENRR